MDCARILAKSTEEFYQSDIMNYALETLKKSRIKNIYVIGRRTPKEAKFTISEYENFLCPPADDIHLIFPAIAHLLTVDSSTPKSRSKTVDRLLNGMILLKFLRFPLNDCGYYDTYSSFGEINQIWDRKRH